MSYQVRNQKQQGQKKQRSTSPIMSKAPFLSGNQQKKYKK